MFDFSGLVTSASKMSMLTSNKANESAWIVSLTFVSFPVLCDHNRSRPISQDHLRPPGEKGQTKKKGFRAVRHVFTSDFRKEREKWPQNTFWNVTSLWPNYDILDFKILTQCVKLLGWRVLQVWWRYLHWFRRYRTATQDRHNMPCFFVHS